MYQRISNVNDMPFENGRIILNADRQTIIKVNGIGGFLWELLSQPATIEQLAARIQEAYDVDYDTALHDTAAFLDQLGRSDLILCLEPLQS